MHRFLCLNRLTAQRHRLFSTQSAAITIAESAAKRINFINSKNADKMAFRISVDSGGCHGYQYVMGLTKEIDGEEDIIFEKDGARVVVDKISLDLCQGSQLEFVEELIGSSFQVTGNPKAESSCGCKISFNVT
ncbi:[4Fe-4S] proteins maturation [Chytriomyces hyalinus]|nr:[4Fe-4S] proteins maturation [Chytriomyces hyalinus]